MLTTVTFGTEVDFPGLFRVSVWIGQLFLIPGLAVLTSRLVTGPYHWRRPLLSHILPALLLPGAFLPLLLVVLPLARLNAPDLILTIAMILTLLMEVVLTFRLTRRMAERNVRFNAEIWIAERNSGSDSRRSGRIARKFLWLPSLLVLLVFLFFPEIWGSLWHLTNRKATLQGYRVPIPTTWFVVYGNPRSAQLSGMVGTGIARGFRLHRHLYVPFSSWSISASGQNGLPRWMQNEQVVATHNFTIGNQTLTCDEYRPQNPAWWTWAPAQPADIYCHNDGALQATFYGEKSHTQDFYKMISGIDRPNRLSLADPRTQSLIDSPRKLSTGQCASHAILYACIQGSRST